MRHRNRTFWSLLHARGESAETIAKAICSRRSHVTQVLNGTRPGTPTKRKILERDLLTPDECAALGWEVPHRAMSHVGLSEEPEPARVDRKVFPLGDYAVSIFPNGKGHAFAVFDRDKGTVAEGDGFDGLGLAESAARNAALKLILKKDGREDFE